MEKKILVTGAEGQVGRELRTLAEQHNHLLFLFTDHEQLDITDAEAVDKYFNLYQPKYCINCAAYTAVDKAETDQKLAQQVNVTGAEYLAQACQKYGAQLIHYSTDYVYHNPNQNRPFAEADPTSPKGVYAQTKLDGELAALKFCQQTLILRTSWVYSSHGHNFVKTMLRLGASRDKLTVIFDQIGTPTYAADLAAATIFILEGHRNGKFSDEQLQGIYHYSNEGVCSWYDFAKAIFEQTQLDCKVLPIETKDYPTPASRPPFSLLNKAKIKATFGIEIPYWKESLKKCLAILHQNEPIRLS